MEVKGMKVQDIRNIAKERGLKVGKMNKTEIIRSIQSAEGNAESDAGNRCR
jgi:hypothetical protein